MPSLTKDKSLLLTGSVVSKWLRVSAKTLRLWSECNQIPATKVGGEWRYRESELAAWVKSKTNPAAQPGTASSGPRSRARPRLQPVGRNRPRRGT